MSLIFPAIVALGFGALIGSGHLPFAPTWLAAFVGAALGDWLSFWRGRRYRETIWRLWPLSRHPDLRERSAAFLAKWARSAFSRASSGGRCAPAFPSPRDWETCQLFPFRSPIGRPRRPGLSCCWRRERSVSPRFGRGRASEGLGVLFSVSKVLEENHDPEDQNRNLKDVDERVQVAPPEWRLLPHRQSTKVTVLCDFGSTPKGWKNRPVWSSTALTPGRLSTAMRKARRSVSSGTSPQR